MPCNNLVAKLGSGRMEDYSEENKMLRENRVKHFHGRLEEDVEEWIRRFSTYAKATKIKGSKRKAANLILNLRGLALDWVDTLTPDIQEDFELLKAVLISEFAKRGDQYDMTKASAIIQRPKEPILAYATRLRKFFNKSPEQIPNSIEMSFFKKGLQPMYREKLIDRGITRIDPAITFLKGWERRRNTNSPDRKDSEKAIYQIQLNPSTETQLLQRLQQMEKSIGKINEKLEKTPIEQSGTH